MDDGEVAMRSSFWLSAKPPVPDRGSQTSASVLGGESWRAVLWRRAQGTALVPWGLLQQPAELHLPQLCLRLPCQHPEDAPPPMCRGRGGGMLVLRMDGVNLRQLLLRHLLHHGEVLRVLAGHIEGRSQEVICRVVVPRGKQLAVESKELHEQGNPVTRRCHRETPPGGLSSGLTVLHARSVHGPDPYRP